ncbi:polysaccharide deacetylase family protein [Luedemannella flava]
MFNRRRVVALMTVTAVVVGVSAYSLGGSPAGRRGRTPTRPRAPRGRAGLGPIRLAARHRRAAPRVQGRPRPRWPPMTRPLDAPDRRGPLGTWTTTGTRTVALTFDDGPDPRWTPAVLALLRRHRVHATFCLIGRNAARHPKLVRAIVAGGHTLCNHTWRHDIDLGRRSPAAIRADLTATTRAIQRAAPGPGCATSASRAGGGGRGSSRRPGDSG